MEIKLRIPGPDQFSFAEIDISTENDLDPKEVRAVFEEYMMAFRLGDGLPPKEWNEVLDNYRNGKGMSVDIGERMNKAQQWLIHELDKSDNRIKRLKGNR